MDFDPRDHDSRDRATGNRHDPRAAFMRDLNLPRCAEREVVRDRDLEYTLRGSETRTLATVGAFRVVPASRLGDHFGAPADPRSGDLRNLRERGLVETVRIPGRRDHAVVLTKRGRELLEIRAENAKDNENRRTPFDPKGRLAPILKRRAELSGLTRSCSARRKVSSRTASRLRGNHCS
jgi:hypothetical protein